MSILSIFLGIGTFLLIVTSLFMVLVVLAQKAKSDGGMGSAMGGGMAEAAFGADTGNVLSKLTIYSSVAFFVLTFALYLGRIYERKHAAIVAGNALPTIAVPAAPKASAPVMPLAPPASLAAPSPTPATAAPATATPSANPPSAASAPAPKSP